MNAESRRVIAEEVDEVVPPVLAPQRTDMDQRLREIEESMNGTAGLLDEHLYSHSLREDTAFLMERIATLSEALEDIRSLPVTSLADEAFAICSRALDGSEQHERFTAADVRAVHTYCCWDGGKMNRPSPELERRYRVIMERVRESESAARTHTDEPDLFTTEAA